MKKYILLVFISISTFFLAQAQKPTKGAMPSGFKMPSIGRVFGKVQDSKTKESIEYASVVLYAMRKDSVISGALTQGNGDFSLEQLPFGKFRLKITFLGFKPLQSVIEITKDKIEQDLGNLQLELESKQLNEAVVTAEKSTVQMNIDRRVFNVDKDITARGGTAEDVLRNVPSVSIDANGNATLRNNATLIYVDGRPTALTLNQIPSDQIDKVEVITNPSAKFEASATGGIVNLVMKKNKKPGYNGVAQAGFGSNYRYNGMASLNLKQNPYNLSLMYNLNRNRSIPAGYNNITNLTNGVVKSYFNQTNSSVFENIFQMGRIGLDYNIDNRNVVTIAETFTAGNFNFDENQLFNAQDAQKTKLTYGDRTSVVRNGFRNYTTQLLFKHNYPKTGKELTADINWNSSKNKNRSDISTNDYFANGVLLPFNPELQQNIGSGSGDAYTAQIDYVNPITDSSKIEIGARSFYKSAFTALSIENLDYKTKQYINNEALSLDFVFNDFINAAYINYAGRWRGIGYQAGVRYEQSNLSGISYKDNNRSFSYDYPSGSNDFMKAVFPSLYLSKKMNNNQEFQLNASRKLNRPGHMQIMPIIMFSDKQNYRVGNPALRPEFINLTELNYQKIFTAGNFLTSFYYKNVENAITSFSYRSPSDSTVLVNTFINAGRSNSLGFDNTLKISTGKMLDWTLNANVWYNSIVANTNNQNLSSKGVNWIGKAIMNLKLPKDFSFQTNGNYESPRNIPQGKKRAEYSIDLGLKKDFFKFASLNLSVNDLFNTRRMGFMYDTPLYIQDLSRRRETRFVKLTLQVRFGKVDASLFKKKKGGMPQGGGEGMDF